MKRLTLWYDGFHAICDRPGCANNNTENCTLAVDEESCPALQAMIDRLAAYEDTGLDPEEIEKFKDVFDEAAMLRLAAKYLGTTPDRLRELAEADKDGHIWIDPCDLRGELFRIKDGKVWACQYWGVQKYNGYMDPQPMIYLGIPPIEHPALCINGNTGEISTDGKWIESVICVPADNIGKTVFLTREAAEKVLEEMK